MAINDFITSTLNLKVDQLDAFDCVRKDDILNLYITLRDDHPDCMYCNGKTVGKGYTHRSYNHLPMAGTPSVIKWKRRRYVCKDCGKSFVEDNPFGPEVHLKISLYAITSLLLL